MRKIATVATRVIWGRRIDDWHVASTRGRVSIVLRGAAGFAVFMVIFSSLANFALQSAPFARPYDFAAILQRMAMNVAFQFLLGVGVTPWLGASLARYAKEHGHEIRGLRDVS